MAGMKQQIFTPARSGHAGEEGKNTKKPIQSPPTEVEGPELDYPSSVPQ